MKAKVRKPLPIQTRDTVKVDRNIYKRGEFSYQVKMMFGGTTVLETFITLAEARAFRDGKKSASVLDPDFKRVLESRIKKTEAANSSLRWLLDKYEIEVTPGKKSATSELYRIGKVKRYRIADVSIYTISPDDVDEFMNQLKAEGVGDGGRRKYGALLSHVFNTAFRRWRYKVSNPIAAMELPAAGKPRNRRLEKCEGEKLLEALDRENKYAGIYARLAIETAMRRGELLGLAWVDVDLKTSVAQLHDTKTGEPRGVPLTPAAIKILRALPLPHEGKVLPIHASGLRGAWDRARSTTGIKGLRIHDLRREGTSRLFETGKLNVMEVAAITGHKTLQMLGVYTVLRPEDLAKKLG
ncbi:MAG: site-specific integrase [Sulfuriferula multivorans]|uniref:Site-specific integrase n=1 Tax=Sulfuriferula multivorans TaxID=1559896 RepID=A0A7C9K9C0_9PROT|nr:site-specific integrase [Sulfuriferula multivorans]